MPTSMAALNDLLEHGIKPRARELAEIIARGNVAVLVYKATETAQRAARALGWQPDRPVFQMNAAAQTRLAAESRAANDAVTARWLTTPRNGRVFVISGRGTLLVNFDQGQGWQLARGSLDAEWLS